MRHGGGAATAAKARARTLNEFVWLFPQPVLVLGTTFLVATMITEQWMDHKLFAAIMIVLPIPLLIVAERIWTKRQDWLLQPREMAEDAGWLAVAGLVFVPLYSDYYETPISEGFKAVRDLSPLQVSLESASAFGLLGSALLVLFLSSFIYYWLHRVQHESLFWWRIHATHHHITKMGCMRGDRTHPLEWPTLFLGTPVALALLGASDHTMAVAGAFGMWNAALNHSNLPLKSLPVYDWFFATAQQHHIHHARALEHSNTNYGCTIILWDRLFGTYCSDTDEGQVGAGRAVPLSVKDQLLLAFYSKEKLTSL